MNASILRGSWNLAARHNPKFLKIFVALLIGFATFTRSPMDCIWQPGEAQRNAGDSTNKVSCDNEEKTQ